MFCANHLIYKNFHNNNGVNIINYIFSSNRLIKYRIIFFFLINSVTSLCIEQNFLATLFMISKFMKKNFYKTSHNK